MKVLWLTNSDDMGDSVPEEQRSFRIAARLVEAATGEPVEITPRVIWPSPALPDLIDEWIGRYQPDIVLFKINGFWYLYPSIPLQVERMFGRRVGRPIARAGLKAASTPWIAHRAMFHLFRRLALKVMHGATHFSPQEVAELVERCARRIVRREDLGLVVRGQLAGWSNAPPGAELFVHRKVTRLCDELHVAYLARDPEGPLLGAEYYKKGDRLHTDARGHEAHARQEAEAITAVWKARQGMRA
jgi:hypothetical protein